MKANPKTVVLYLGMIGFIVAAFSAISSYGATHLQAPRAIGGQYTLEGLSSTGCFTAPPLLVVGQSGSYLNADILPPDAKKNLLTRALKGNGLLHGRVVDGKMLLEGKTRLGTCTPRTVAVEVVPTGNALEGRLLLEGRPIPLLARLADKQ